jgi:hypothetical protein
MKLKVTTFALLDDLGLQVRPTKGYHTPVQVGDHLGMTIDMKKNEFRALEAKLANISALAKQLPVRSAKHKRWVPVKSLASLAGKAQFLHLAVPVARFYLRELHDVVKTTSSWSGTIRVTKQLKRDPEWWRTVPEKHNGAPIFKAIETTYLHCDSIGFGWGAVLNDCIEAREFWSGSDKHEHITYKELKAVRCAIKSFLPELKGRRLRLHEDNKSVVGVLTHLTSGSQVMMAELRKLFLLTDENNIKIKTTYIRSAANIWADWLSREQDSSDLQLAKRVFDHLDATFHKHSIDRFASRENKHLPRYNTKWRDGESEAVDSLHLSDELWRAEVNWCNPPWCLLDDLTAKLRQSGVAATVIALKWPRFQWFQQLEEMAEETIEMPPARNLFSPQRQEGHAGIRPSAWSVVAFKLHFRRGWC